MIRERRWREGRRGWREVEIKGREGGNGRDGGMMEEGWKSNFMQKLFCD